MLAAMLAVIGYEFTASAEVLKLAVQVSGEEEPLQMPLTVVEFTVKVNAPVGAEAPLYVTVAESVALAAP